jgi:hypothetical protein
VAFFVVFYIVIGGIAVVFDQKIDRRGVKARVLAWGRFREHPRDLEIIE